ncbi:MAG: hypothetical protein JXB39_14325 [Deltaproteobacteria bacterium]|nr:hypothetical protein [Deltaproteobacteria bacterium]
MNACLRRAPSPDDWGEEAEEEPEDDWPDEGGDETAWPDTDPPEANVPWDPEDESPTLEPSWPAEEDEDLPEQAFEREGMRD